MASTKIEWADRVWNPVTGCTKVSEGCRHCYAETMAKRFWKERKFSDVQYNPEKLFQPLSWKKPSRVFVNSMSDLFHKDVPFTVILNIWRVMMDSKKHTFMILTKRPERMIEFIKWLNITDDEKQSNIWLGVSVEDQKTADERIPLLLKTPAAVRFVSCEPLLGPVDLWGARYSNPNGGKTGAISNWPGGLDWVIAGGESGPSARPMHPNWVRLIKDDCVAAGVPFFFKQWGEFHPEFKESDVCRVCGCSEFDPCEINGGCYWVADRLCSTCKNTPFVMFPDLSKDSGQVCFRVGKKLAGRLLDGREWNEFPMSESQEVV